MDITSILRPEAVRIAGHVTSKKRLFHFLGECAGAAYGLDVSAAINALQDRESLGSTGVGHGVALPHARLDGPESVRGVFLRLERPLAYNSVDGQPVDLVFALFAPADSGVDHLKALALVSRTMRDAGICAKLRANADPATLHAVLTEARATKAA